MKICEHKLYKLTMREWFEWARDNGYPWAQSALNQTNQISNTVHTTLVDALISFRWGSSIEGWDFWIKVYNEILHENLRT